MARIIGALFWKGKTFSPNGASLKNRISPFSVPAIPANVYVDASRTDGAPCIAIDYSRTSSIAWFMRDEIREVRPGLFLGKAYALGIPLIFFSLESV